MEQVSPYITLFHKIDTLKSLTDSTLAIQQAQSVKIDSLCSLTERLAVEQTTLDGQIDTISTQLRTISEYGIGYSDAAVHIAIPLIIALFAFAFTYLFSVITRINEKYNSESISAMFKSSYAYRSYMWWSGISVGYIILMGVVSLIVQGDSYHGLMVVLSWVSLFVAGVYAGVILWFVKTCLQYDDNLKMVPLIIKRYKKEKDNSWALNIRTNRLIDFCKYVVKEHNGNLLAIVLSSVNELDKEERDDEKKHVEYYTMNFYESLVDSFIQFPHDSETENSLLWNWSRLFRNDRLPFTDVIYQMLGKMVEAVKRGRFSLFEAYMEKCRFGYDFIIRMPIVSYACGANVNEQSKMSDDSLDMWRELREVHYLAAAYLFSIGHYEVAGALKKGAGYNMEAFFPTTTPQILKQFAICKEKQDKETGSFVQRYWSIDKVIGHKYDRDILEKFTAIMLLLAMEPEEDENYVLDENKRNIIQSTKSELIRFGQLWEKYSDLLIRYPEIKDKKIEERIEEGVNHLSCGVAKEPSKSIFDIKLAPKEKDSVKYMFSTILYSNRASIPNGLDGVLSSDKVSEINMGAYSFLTGKQKALILGFWHDHGVINDVTRVFRSRYLYMVYEAISHMRIRDVSVKGENFDKWFLKLVGDNGEQYVIIDTNSKMGGCVVLDRPKDGAVWLSRQSFKGAFYYNAGLVASSHIRDVPLVKSFENTVVIARFADMPVLVPTTEYEKPEVTIEDNSDKEKGWAVVRITVDPYLAVKFNKNVEVTRVTIKKG